MKKVVSAWILTLVLLCTGVMALAEMPTLDRAGNPFVMPEKVETIASLAPSVTQVLIDLGVADKIIAVDTYSVGTKGLDETLPAFEMMAPDMEQMIALSPDIVFVTGMSLSEGTDPFTSLTDVGITVAYIPSSDSIEGIMADNLFIGQVVGNEEDAMALNGKLSTAIETLRVQTDAPVPVYFEISPAPYLYSFGNGTFLNEMIELLGGKNIFADQESWLSVSEEAVIAAEPEIIFTNVDWEEDAVANILAREGWESVPAVENGRVYLIDADASSQPNHRIVYALEEMAEALK